MRDDGQVLPIGFNLDRDVSEVEGRDGEIAASGTCQ